MRLRRGNGTVEMTAEYDWGLGVPLIEMFMQLFVVSSEIAVTGLFNRTFPCVRDAYIALGSVEDPPLQNEVRQRDVGVI